MAMIKCPMCEEGVSDKAKKCPHCNAILKKNKAKTIIITMVSIILVSCLTYGAVIGVQNYQKQKAIQEYNESVYEAVISFHDTFKTVDEKIRNRNYTSLKSLVGTLEVPIEKFDELPINEESEIGTYIKSIKNHPMYTTFKSLYIDSDEIDLDYGLTSSGHAYIITVYTEEILKVELPEIDQ